MIVRPSARKHGISEEDAVAAASSPLVSGPLDDENPQRQLRIGFDAQARLLELRAMGCPKVNLHVHGSNAQVVAFYEHLGYTVDDTIDHTIDLGKRLIEDPPPGTVE